MSTQPNVRSVLDAVSTKARLFEVARHFGVSVPVKGTRPDVAAALARSEQVRFRSLIEWMSRDELRQACERHGLITETRARPKLAAKLLEAACVPETSPPAALFGARVVERSIPRTGDIATVRQRQYLVESVAPPGAPDEATRVDLVCLDDDAQGRRLSVLWELELGARVLRPEADLLKPMSRLDPVRHFAAYFHALKWSQVTATRADLFQSPFRAGIRLVDHQLTPLKKALELPRANLFIADDVGLGKTIEAGLVMTELELRQRVDFVLIVCPAALCLQWRAEMEKRFGQLFEIVGRDFVARRRRERGFGVNPWGTHSRFIISYQTLRRSEYREPLLVQLGARMRKSLLVLDEAHAAAPATASRYAIDSKVTRMIRDELTGRFENRLFLSATPHNGHSNSFSALMEMLDPQRFTRGVPIEAGSKVLSAVMVRRLKRDLKALGKTDFPERKVVREIIEGEAHPEVKLSHWLAQYTQLMKPEKGRARLVFINLQKRLLSSVEAFHRTLSAHADRVASGLAAKDSVLDLRVASVRARDEDEDAYGVDDEQLEGEAAAEIASASAVLPSPEGQARELLERMLDCARQNRHRADAKVELLVAWIREHLLKGKRWEPRRVIVFTEYGDSMRYLRRTLGQALEDTELAEERIAVFHGGMGDAAREELQEAFNGDPELHPVRILIATDAAREGLNLQNYASDLFHYDVPWNPARMEQRNGRIDRTLQPAEVVRCHYFVYPSRAEDAVLDKLVEKVETIQSELGSLGEVVVERLESALATGIGEKTLAELEEAEKLPRQAETAKQELESQRSEVKALKKDIDDARRILGRSRDVIDFREELLQDAVNVGLELSGAGCLTPCAGFVEGQPAFDLPELPQSWERTLDTLRRPRRRDEPEWQWRKEPPQPVVFRALDRIGEPRVHLHLGHPFVQRILSRFLAQGFGAEDLSRATVVPESRTGDPRAIAFGRLSLFGPGAARLHDELIVVSAPWREGGDDDHLVPSGDTEDARLIERLEQAFVNPAAPAEVPQELQRRLAATAATDFAKLWPHVRDEADGHAHTAAQLLGARGEKEADDLRKILVSQRVAIEKQLSQQLELFQDFAGDSMAAQREQVESERDEMRKRLGRIEQELRVEPDELRALYRVSLKRLVPVGLVYLWPTTSL
jgi:superfamily II DNA or RNA helicase